MDLNDSKESGELSDSIDSWELSDSINSGELAVSQSSVEEGELVESFVLSTAETSAFLNEILRNENGSRVDTEYLEYVPFRHQVTLGKESQDHPAPTECGSHSQTPETNICERGIVENELTDSQADVVTPSDIQLTGSSGDVSDVTTSLPKVQDAQGTTRELQNHTVSSECVANSQLPVTNVCEAEVLVLVGNEFSDSPAGYVSLPVVQNAQDNTKLLENHQVSSVLPVTSFIETDVIENECTDMEVDSEAPCGIHLTSSSGNVSALPVDQQNQEFSPPVTNIYETDVFENECTDMQVDLVTSTQFTGTSGEASNVTPSLPKVQDALETTQDFQNHTVSSECVANSQPPVTNVCKTDVAVVVENEATDSQADVVTPSDIRLTGSSGDVSDVALSSSMVQDAQGNSQEPQNYEVSSECVTHSQLPATNVCVSLPVVKDAQENTKILENHPVSSEPPVIGIIETNVIENECTDMEVDTEAQCDIHLKSSSGNVSALPVDTRNQEYSQEPQNHPFVTHSQPPVTNICETEVLVVVGNEATDMQVDKVTPAQFTGTSGEPSNVTHSLSLIQVDQEHIQEPQNHPMSPKSVTHTQSSVNTVSETDVWVIVENELIDTQADVVTPSDIQLPVSSGDVSDVTTSLPKVQDAQGTTRELQNHTVSSECVANSKPPVTNVCETEVLVVVGNEATDMQVENEPQLINSSSGNASHMTLSLPLHAGHAQEYTQETQNYTMGFDTQAPDIVSKRAKTKRTKKRYLSRVATRSIKSCTIPILICDLAKIETVDMFLHWFNGKYFNHVLLYGKVFLVKLKDEKKKGVYKLDDGTGVVKVHFQHHSSKFMESKKAVQFIKTAVGSIRKTEPGLAEAIGAINDWIDRDLKETEQTLEMNTKVMVYGRPFYSKYHNEIQISAESVYPDREEDATFQIEFKKFLNSIYLSNMSKQS